MNKITLKKICIAKIYKSSEGMSFPLKSSKLGSLGSSGLEKCIQFKQMLLNICLSALLGCFWRKFYLQVAISFYDFVAVIILQMESDVDLSAFFDFFNLKVYNDHFFDDEIRVREYCLA